MAYTFNGGIHVEEYKNTRRCRIEAFTPVKSVAIPLQQHIGVPCEPLVAVGDTVTVGQKIGDVKEGLGCPVHASVSGKVMDIAERPTSNGSIVKSIIIENDGLDTPCPDLTPYHGRLSDASTEEIIRIVREAGITGMGGASFPTYAKIQSAVGKVDKIIVNCAECEPFITANHRLLLENPASVINGVKILLKAFGVHTAWLAVEDNKLDAINKLEELTAESNMIEVKVMKTKYPQGDERQLIFALTGEELPAGKLPADVGCVIFNAETCSAIFRAFSRGMPLVKRIITVDGDCIRYPRNLLVPIGTSIGDIIEFCGGLSRTPKKIIAGGPMMGQAQWDIRTPVVKGTSAILLFSNRFDKRKNADETCIRCGKCVRNCPMHLMPNYIAQYSRIGDHENAAKYGAMSCVECGSCSYNCPGGVEIVQFIRMAKATIRAEQKKRDALSPNQSKQK
ncbi:MAG: electron transport complex subunit RsxC [Clostridia bacterium]|nr:electron transport complex subunit RsxC [Clostridia bacterium]